MLKETSRSRALRRRRDQERWCAGSMPSSVAHGWGVSAMTSGGPDSPTFTVATPTKHYEPSGKIARGELHGQVFGSSDEAFDAMHARGYGHRYYPRPCYFIHLRLPRRVRKFIRANPLIVLDVLRRVLPERDWKHYQEIRRLESAPNPPRAKTPRCGNPYNHRCLTPAHQGLCHTHRPQGSGLNTAAQERVLSGRDLAEQAALLR